MELISFYKKCLSDILQIKHPNSLMKKIIDTIHSTNERIYIYDVNKNYASLFLSNEIYTVYLYPDLTCSLLQPPSRSTIPHWSTYITHHTKEPLELKIEFLDELQESYKKDTINEPLKIESILKPFKKPQSPNGPDFGADFEKEFDFTFEPIKKETVKPIQKLKTVVKKLSKRPIWK
jgi:hypothetical protein